MTEKVLRQRLRRSGWSATNYACVNRLLTAALTRDPLIRTCWVSGSGRFTSNQDHHEQTKRMLKALGLGYTEGNDSPRGGLTGQWIKLDARAMRLLQGVRDEAEAKRQRLADRQQRRSYPMWHEANDDQPFDQQN